MFSNYEGGAGIGASQRVTGDVAIGVSGRPTRVLSLSWLSGGAASTAILNNGTATTDEIRFQKVGTASDSVVADFGETGMLFPNGCFFDADANLTFAMVNFVQ